MKIPETESSVPATAATVSRDASYFRVRIYFEDTDFSGNVYHAAYLRFFERARTEWLRDKGVHHSVLIKQGLAFAVRRMEISFDRPAHIDDLVDIETTITSVTGARMHIGQIMRRDGEMLVSAKVEIVMINQAGRPMRLPKTLVS